MLPDEEKALARAEEKLRRIEEKTGQMLAEARAELARAMLAAGPAAVARRNGMSRQGVHDYIKRHITP